MLFGEVRKDISTILRKWQDSNWSVDGNSCVSGGFEDSYEKMGVLVRKNLRDN
jgi:hypothetical protein